MQSMSQIEDAEDITIIDKLNKIDEDPELEELDTIAPGEIRCINKNLMSKYRLMIEESHTQSEFLDYVGQAFSTIAQLANTITNKDSKLQLIQLATKILDKITELAQDSKIDQQDVPQNEDASVIYDQVIQKLAIILLTQLEGQENISDAKLTVTATLSLLSFIQTLQTKDLKPQFSKDFATVLIHLSHNLFNSEKKLLKRVKSTISFIKTFKNLDQEALFQVAESMPQMSRNSFIPLLVSEFNYHLDSLSQMSDKLNTFVLNDKEKHNFYNVRYFAGYLSTIGNQIFVKDVLSQIEFILNRNGNLLGVVAQIVDYLNSINIDEALLKSLSSDIITDNFLMNADYQQKTSLYFRNLSLKIKEKPLMKTLLIDFLLKKFTSTKAQFNPSQRQNIIKHTAAILEVIPESLIDQEILDQINSAFVEHLFSVKEEPILRECHEELTRVLLKSNKFDAVAVQVKKYFQKASNLWHVMAFNELISHSKPELNDILQVLIPQFKILLVAENFKTTANYSSILSLVGFFVSSSKYLNDDSLIQFLASNSSILNYLATDQGYINTQAYFQKPPSTLDVKYHLMSIQMLINYHHKIHPLSVGDVQLRDTLFELLLNQTSKFREHYYLDVLENLCSSAETTQVYSSGLLKSLYLKVKQISLRPLQLTREESPHVQPLSVTKMIQLSLKFILRHKNNELTQDEFFSILKIVCHPYVSPSNKSLLKQVKSLHQIFRDKEFQLEGYVEKYGKELVDFAIVQRTGIMASDRTLRDQAVNMATFLAYYGGIELFMEKFVAILDYKPFELLQKLENLFKEEFDRISHYDLMFYSEICKDLQTTYNKVDSKLYQEELGIQQEQVAAQANNQQEEEKKVEQEPEVIDPMKLAAQMLKAQAAQKKAAAAKKGTKGAPAKAAPKKDAPKATAPAKKEEAKQVEPAMDKETRNKYDRANLLNYFNLIQNQKQTQIETVYQIIKRVNQNGFHLDTTFAHLLLSMIKLLNYSYSRFSTIICFQSILSNHKRDPLFAVKNELVSCMQAISAGRIFLKHQREFQQIFQHIETNANLDSFDKGYTQLVMTMGNYVLKDLSVNLSVKEQALSVIQSFLSTDKVQNIELVRVTINMMKSSYNSPNLQQYLTQLLLRLKPEFIALILQRLFEYEPVPRMAMLKELVDYDQPLFCPPWMATQFWVLQFDEESSKLARRIWNRYGMALRTAVIDLAQEHKEKNVFHYLRSNNTNIYDATLKATVAAIEIFQNRFDLIIDDLVEFYNQELQIIDRMTIKSELESQESKSSEGSDFQTTASILLDQRVNRKAVADILIKCAHLVQAASFKKVFEFLVTKGCLDPSEVVAKASMGSALAIIKAKGNEYAEEILKILEKFINEKQKYSEQSKNQAIIMIGSLAQYLDNTSQKKLVGTFEKMLELLHTPSELIRQSICKVIPQLARYFDDKSRKFLEDNLHILRNSMEEKLLRGSAYAVAGIVKGLGMQTITQFNIVQTIQNECFKKQADPLRKVSGLYLFECLSISLGKVFEMQVETILPFIMGCISDHKENVRRAAIQANRTIMGNLSNHAIKVVLPLFLKGLATENWRSKLASVEALGNMAFCAPRQISGFLPQIVKGIREVLNDTHEKVHEAALQAIQNIGSVIKCPEIAEILESLVKALSNPSQHLKQALKMLLETSFVHAIDAPSLSLLVPILDSGLMMHDNESKTLASRLMGNICNLTQDPEDLLPYIKILMPAIKNSLFDSIPEIRASAGKALGSLSKGLGLDNSNELIEWLTSVLNTRNLLSSERQGAAQGFAEIISVHGTKFFDATIEKILENSNSEDPQIRESYRAVMVFLATCYDQFVKHLPKLLPIMIQGLSDEVEDVRKISMRNVKICIKQFARQAPNQLVLPIMKMMFHQDFKVRQSSSVLMYQLVKELENDIIKSQPKYVSNETKQEILGAMFILRYDSIERVATQAAQIWKNLIDNQLKIVKQILPTLVNQIFESVQSEWMELEEMGLNCMRGITEKFGEKVVSETLDILEGYFERAKTAIETHAIAKTIYNMTVAAPIKLLTDLRSRFLGIMDAYLTNDNQDIRDLSGKVFIVTFQKTYEPLYVSQTIDRSFLKKLHSLVLSKSEAEAKLLVQTLIKIIKDAQDLKIEDKLIRLCQLDIHATPITIAQARILAAVSPKIAQHMFKKKFYQNVLNALIQELTIDEVDDETRISEVLNTFSELISQVDENEIVTINEQIIADFYLKCRDKGRLPFYVDFIAHYCSKATVNYEKFASQYLRNVLILMNDNNEKLVEKVVKAFNSIIAGLQKENQFTHIALIKEVIEDLAVDQQTIQYGGDGSRDRTVYTRKNKAQMTIKMLEKPEGVKTLSTIIQNSITHGSIEVRIDSAILFQYLIDFSKIEAIKLELIKICGALIRVVNDKFPAELKIQIFLALKLILVKANLFVKAMAPQLQTTFLKAFNDQLATPVLRKIVVECLVQFLKIVPKVDPIVKELATMLDGDKIDRQSKIEVAESLAIIIKLSGKSIQAAMSQGIYQTLLNIVTNKKAEYLEKTLVNIAVAMAFLAFYTQDVKAQENLFDTFDNSLDIYLSLGVKFGILMSGVALTDRASFLSKLENYISEILKDMSGIAEIDCKPYDEDVDQSNPEKSDYNILLPGALTTLSHIGDAFIRRFANPKSGTPEQVDVFNLLYKSIAQSGIITSLNDESPFEQTHKQVVFFLSSIPVKPNADDKFNEDLQQIIKSGMEYINNFYLEFESKKDVFPAIINLTSLNYDNFLDQSNDKLKLLTKENAKERIYSPLYQECLDANLKELAVELLFI